MNLLDMLGTTPQQPVQQPAANQGGDIMDLMAGMDMGNPTP